MVTEAAITNEKKKESCFRKTISFKTFDHQPDRVFPFPPAVNFKRKIRKCQDGWWKRNTTCPHLCSHREVVSNLSKGVTWWSCLQSSQGRPPQEQFLKRRWRPWSGRYLDPFARPDEDWDCGEDVTKAPAVKGIRALVTFPFLHKKEERKGKNSRAVRKKS